MTNLRHPLRARATLALTGLGLGAIILVGCVPAMAWGTSPARSSTPSALTPEGSARPEMRDAASVAIVTERIRAMAEDPARTLTFAGTGANPYTIQSKRRVEHYLDNKGVLYWVEPATNLIVQFAPAPNSSQMFASTGSLSAIQLRTRAETYLGKVVTDFNAVAATYVYRPSSKPGGSSFAFRWEAQTRPAGEDLTAFIQVVLSPPGEVMSFSDTRVLY